jgi:putative ABC transport system ATP-binding protein
VLIEFLNVTKIYDLPGGQVRALHNVTLRVAEGEFIAVMGPSGSGKSTMMNLLGLLDRPTRGRYLMEGDDVGSRGDHELALLRRHKIGFIFQSFNLLPRLSALKNVALPLMYAGVAPREREERARAMLARVGLSDRGHHRPQELSGGQQQRVAIARALVNNPRLVLADEPTGNLDSKTGRDVLALLQGLNAQGVTIVIITHDAHVAQHARRVVRLLDGVVVEDRSVNGKNEVAIAQRRAG